MCKKNRIWKSDTLPEISDTLPEKSDTLPEKAIPSLKRSESAAQAQRYGASTPPKGENNTEFERIKIVFEKFIKRFSEKWKRALSFEP